MKTLSALLSAGLTLSMLPSVVNATEYYRVEVMLFTYLDENSAREEHWPLLKERALAEEAAIQAALEEEASPDAETETAGGATNDALQISEDQSSDLTSDTAEEMNTEEEGTENASPVTLLDDLEFENAANRFGYRSDMKIVWHQAWVEELQDSANAYDHEVAGSYEEENFRIEVSGSLNLYRSRYIHIRPDLEVDQLIFTIPDEAPLSDEPADATEDGVMTMAVTPETMNNSDALPGAEGQMMIVPSNEGLTNEPVTEPEPEWIPLRAAKIERSRRMRSGEVHYLDHPLLGMVVKVTPWEEPEESQEEAPENGASEENTVNSDQ
ncbi:MAG: CsiV family protein [Thalassolituus sp.]|uniref:CsiV family protein n=1 Tax=Thalassolituus sp. TaxID=2030822 RepID=UPI0023B3EE21|nr:CsiV family protein [Thalassolituus sp.]MDQ4423787.1 CsiV family protein [Thalassolituus sp.]MDQ4425766.1 CsiV family protein [Thalassolituus sp.]